MRTIQALGATPSSLTGALWGQAMAIADAAVRAELDTMLHAQRHTTGRAEARCAADGSAPRG